MIYKESEFLINHRSKFDKNYRAKSEHANDLGCKNWSELVNRLKSYNQLSESKIKALVEEHEKVAIIIHEKKR